MIDIGTAGFSYRDWMGVFYPAGLPQSEWLAFYAREFSTLELNTSFYGVPAARTAAGWAARTPDGFRFAVKAYRGLTHERTAPDFAAFAAGLQPLAEAGKLACVLAQFPQSFRPTPESRDYLQRLRDGLADALAETPVVVEFRAAAWAAPETFDLLRKLGLGFVVVDEPRLAGLMPPLTVVTSRPAYLRLHGRNAATWHRHKHPSERYDYLYSPAEMDEIAAQVRQMAAQAEETLVYFK